MESLSTRAAVAAYLDALAKIAAAWQGADEEQRAAVVRQLQSSAMLWGATAEAELVDAGMAAESCGAVVSVLRLLHSSSNSLPLSQGRGMPCACAFLALACTVRTFEEARDLPVPGREVSISGLQSEAGQRLNGTCGTIARFHPESGRFIVMLSKEDPPSEWKKIRAQNLTATPQAALTQAADGAQECSRACLEAVADIFDDLLLDMMTEEEEAPAGALMLSQLAASMWEVLVSCAAGSGTGALGGRELLDLCGGDISVCALFARHALAAHISAQANCFAFGLDVEQQARLVGRVRNLQETLARAFCGLCQPAALWGESENGPGDAKMADLQADLEKHVRKVAEAAVHAEVLEVMADAADFHLTWALANPGQASSPLALPLLLYQLVIAILSPAGADRSSDVQRHIQMLTPELLGLTCLLAKLAIGQLQTNSHGVDISVAMRTALDAVVALVANGLWSLGAEAAVFVQMVQMVTDTLLSAPPTSSDPALLARLVLIQLQQPLPPAIADAYSGLSNDARAAFWRQLRSRCRLLRRPASEVEAEAAAWLGDSQHPMAGESPEAEKEPDPVTGGQEINRLIEQCVGGLSQSLRQAPPPAMLEEAPIAAIQKSTEQPVRLGALDLPQLPGQQPRDAAGAPKRTLQHLARTDLAKIRGVDPAAAPQELRCAIDGKLLATPMRSPYGHIFEKETLGNWLSRCGSVCPITGKPLRMEDCSADQDVQKRVLEWVKVAKAEHKRKAQERRERRRQAADGGGEGLE